MSVSRPVCTKGNPAVIDPRPRAGWLAHLQRLKLDLQVVRELDGRDGREQLLLSD
jgi:hypothetical protein